MILKQYYLGCLAHASYLLGDEKSRTAAVVDPQRDIDRYIADARDLGMEIKYVFLTHFHADFLAGHIELRNRTNSEIVMGRRARTEFAFKAMTDGDVVEFGDVRLQILETPGHTPEGISILVFDLAKSAETPHAVLTGDTLFIGDVGRPDLLASVGATADELAHMLFDSIGRLRELPETTLVYPAHGAGSLCGKSLSSETVSTIGEQRKYNYALQPMSREAFVKLVTSDQPDAPDYFVYDAVKNRQERPDLDAVLRKSLVGLSLAETSALVAKGAQLLDVREAADFEGGHYDGALNIALQGQYATWAGTLLGHDKPIVVIAGDGDEEEAVMRLGRIGFDNVEGYLKGGMRALENRPDLLATVARVTAVALSDLLAGPHAPAVLDVRSEKEHAAGSIAGSVNIPLQHLHERMAEVPQDRVVAVHCAGGYRSAIAVGILAAGGHRKLLDLVGGFKAWEASKLPVVGAGASCGVAQTCAART